MVRIAKGLIANTLRSINEIITLSVFSLLSCKIKDVFFGNIAKDMVKLMGLAMPPLNINIKLTGLAMPPLNIS
jgi:hypothetical protein